MTPHCPACGSIYFDKLNDGYVCQDCGNPFHTPRTDD